MTRTGHRNKTPLPEDQEEELPETFEEIPAKRGNISYTFRIAELLGKCDSDATPTYTLYKYDNPGNPDDKSFIERYVREDPPTEDEIGRAFGSGRYLLMLAMPNGADTLCRTYRFRVNERYDKIAYPQAAAVPQSFAPVEKGLTGIQLIEIVERMMSRFIPLFIRNPDPDIKKLLFQNYQDTAEILKKQNLSTIKALTELRESGDNMQGEEVPEKETSIIEQIAPFLQQFLPLLTGGGAKAEAASSIVKATPQFAKIMQDRGQYKRLITHLDKTEGKEKVDKILSVLKLKR